MQSWQEGCFCLEERLSVARQSKIQRKGTDEKLEERSLIRIKRQRQQARNVKRMTGKLDRGSVTQAFHANAEHK
jgi:peptide deformylase